MKTTIITFFCIFLYACSLQAQLKGKISDSKNNPVIGAHLYWLGGEANAISDAEGRFQIDTPNNGNTLIVTFVGFLPDTLTVTNFRDEMEIILREGLELTEVSIVKRLPGNQKSRLATIQTEKISSAELLKAACCNLSESFETNASVDVSYSDAATGAKQIKLLGLSGAYVQIMTENMPNLRGIASLYGLNYIPGPWMESIQVSKGTASVINGYEAMTGQINVEYKKPEGDEIVSANLFGSSAGRMEVNADASAKLSENLSTGILAHYSDELVSIDENKDGFMDMPMTRQINLANRWSYRSESGYEARLFVRALSENRESGLTNGNYKIEIDTKRYEMFLKNGFIINAEKAESVGLILSGSIHTQNAMYGSKAYDGKQDNLYANLIYSTTFGAPHKLTAGASFNLDNFNETLLLLDSADYPRKETTAGIFAEYSLNINDKFIALAGLRVDNNSIFGTFLTPRFHLKYNASEHLLFRASAGKGFRSPNILAENNNFLASNRAINIDFNLKQEEAWNYGISAQGHIDIADRELGISGDFYHTNFVNQIVADMDSDPHTVHFSNLYGKSFSNTVQIEANFEILKGLTLTAAHRIVDVKTTIGGELREKPLTSRSKSLLSASYQTPLKKWQFDFTAQFNGGGRLPDPDSANPLWEKNFEGFTILNAQISKFFKTWSIYLGSENLTNFVQKNAIIDVANPSSNDFDASMVWGPLHGRKIYLGLRWALDRKQ